MSRPSEDRLPRLNDEPLDAASVPAELDILIGRDSAVEAVSTLLAESRLVTVTGCGGIGKTRVGLRVADGARGSFADGVVLAELADVADDDADQLGTRLLVACGIRDNAPDPVESRLVCHLRERTLLLVLDHCEHVLAALMPMVTTLLQGARGLKVLATSRCRLGVKGERLYELPPLSCRPIDGDTAEAVKLLVARAAETDVMVAADDPAAIKLCELQGGLPLAIELAAARLRIWGLHEVLRQLSGPLEIAGGIDPVNQAYHPKLRATMESSYAQLSPQARCMWAVVAEFRVPFTAQRGLEVCSGLGLRPDEAIEAFEELLDNSILTRIREDEKSSDEPAQPESRFGMHEPLRRYGRHLQPEGITRDDIRRAHAEYFARLADRAATEWYGPNEIAWLRVMSSAICSFEATVAYFLDNGEAERALELAVNVCRTRVHMYAGLLAAGRRLVAKALAGQPGQPTELQVVATAMEAWVAFGQGQGDAGRELLKRAQVMADDLAGSPPSALLFTVGAAMALNSEPATWTDSIAVLDQAATAATEAGNETDAATRNLFAAIAAAFHGDSEAITRAAMLVQDAERVGAGWSRGIALWTLALAEYQHGDVDNAVKALREALLVSQELDDTNGLTWCVWLAAVIMASRGRDAAAGQLFGAVESLQHVTGLIVAGLGPFLRVELAARGVSLREHDEQSRVAIDAGRKLSRQEAVNLALMSIDEQESCPVVDSLTAREGNVIELVAKGLTNKDIAARLSISTRTVETHVSNAMRKLGVSSRTELTILVLRAQR